MANCFNDCNAETNGEVLFYRQYVQPRGGIILDVGCRSDSVFTDFEGEVHYFDPVLAFIEQLKQQPNKNSAAFFNNFGLSDCNDRLEYYPRYQSFFNRTVSCHQDDSANKIYLDVKRAEEYIEERTLGQIDFLKIDTEGYELKVLVGFGERLKNVKVIQFEYGGTYLDSGVKMQEVVDYLKKHGFSSFSYLSRTGLQTITDFRDHYQYCNIVCFNVNE